MRLNFPFLNGAQNKTLFIIGNGFDLYHDLLTKYKHFYSWLILNGHEQFAADLQIICPKLDNNIETLWSNFEKALGNYDLKTAYQYFYKSPDELLGDNKYKIASLSASDNVRNLCKKIRPLIKEWIRQINTQNIKPKIELSKESWYLTFNYTRTLEDCYNIPKEHVCHIHGCVDDYEELVTGHDYKRILEVYGAKSDEEEIAKQKIINTFNNLAKNKKEQLEKNETFFESLPEIKHIVVFGHSLADIDYEYFGKILTLAKDNAIWHFSIQSNNIEDENRIEAFKKWCEQSANHFCINVGENIKL